MTEFSPHHRLVGVVVRDIVISTGRGGSKWDVGDASSHQPFSNMFLNDENNFFIISSLFDNNKPYALSTHNGKCANKMHDIW